MGNFYKLDEAIDLINKKVNFPLKRTELIRLLKLISECGSIAKGKKKFIEIGKSEDVFSYRINQLRKLGINPVNLPSEWDISFLENLYEQLEASLSLE